MILWLVVIVCCALTIAGLVWPLLSGRVGRATRTGLELAIYRDQLSEVRREADRGLLGDQEREAASTEIARRMLALGEVDSEELAAARRGASGDRERRVAAAVLTLLVPAAALGLYLTLGSPQAPDYPLAGREAPAANFAEHGDGSMDAMVGRLAAKLRDNPKNLDGWILIARSYTMIGRHQDAALAYQKAAELSGGQIELVGNMAESLVNAAGGQVTNETQSLFARINKANPNDVRARYYLGLAKAQTGDGENAVRLWLALEADSPPDAPWLPVLRQRIEATAQTHDLDLAALAPLRPLAQASESNPEPGPSAEQMAAAQSMSSDDQLTMIRGMVGQLAGRLEEEPDDIEGWLRLVRSYLVLGEAEKAEKALRRSASIARKLQSPLIGQIRETAAQLQIDLGEGSPDSAGAIPDSD